MNRNDGLVCQKNKRNECDDYFYPVSMDDKENTIEFDDESTQEYEPELWKNVGVDLNEITLNAKKEERDESGGNGYLKTWRDRKTIVIWKRIYITYSL